MNDLKTRLREVMAELGLESAAELAKYCKVSEGLVSQWFSGDTNLGAKPLKALSRTQFSVDWLVDGKLPKYRPKESDSQPQFSMSTDETTPSEEDFSLIPQLDVRAACGPSGKFNDHVVVKGGLAFKKSFIREMGLTEATARIINADGPSMEPTIGHGRVVMVNLSDREPQDSKVFLICDEDGGMVLKRLIREYEPSIGATVWKIRSDNPDKRKYPDKVWPEDARACIVGRAVWFDGLL